MSARVVSCPQCGKPVEWSPANRYRPFCSERCKMVDLDRWLTGQYAIPGESIVEEEEKLQVEEPEPEPDAGEGD